MTRAFAFSGFVIAILSLPFLTTQVSGSDWLLSICAAWFVVAILRSDWSYMPYLRKLWCIFLIATTYAAAWAQIHFEAQKREYSQMNSVFKPAYAIGQEPSTICSPEMIQGHPTVTLGSITIIVTRSPQIIASFEGRPSITAYRADNGSLSIVLEIFDVDGDSVVTFKDGRLKVNKGSIWEDGSYQTDQSTLVLKDHQHKLVLNIHDDTRRAVTIKGAMIYGSNLQIGEVTTLNDTSSLHDVCSDSTIYIYKNGEISM